MCGYPELCLNFGGIPYDKINCLLLAGGIINLLESKFMASWKFHLHRKSTLLPDNGRVNLILPVLENSFLCGLLLIIGLLQLDLEERQGHDLDSLLVDNQE